MDKKERSKLKAIDFIVQNHGDKVMMDEIINHIFPFTTRGEVWLWKVKQKNVSHERKVKLDKLKEKYIKMVQADGGMFVL